jgi:hypothetical protein
MSIHFTTIGLALSVILAPICALAQDAGTAASSLDGTATSPDSAVPDSSANPFTGAAGADKFYQDNSLTGSAQSDTTGTTGPGAANSGGQGSNISNANPAGTLPTPDDSSAAGSANPFAAAAGANRFYQDNSLTGSSTANSLGALGGMDSGAASWATTP